MSVTIVVPTFNEAPNVAELVSRIERALIDLPDAEVIFVDDSTDDTPQVVTRVATTSALPVRLIHRERAVGGLSGAVLEGIAASNKQWCVVMDGDLQHPPELIPALLASGEQKTADIVVASRYCPGGSHGGLSNWSRRFVSSLTTGLTRGMFPVRLRECSDPMTGFFALRRESLDMEVLRPRGFKILLEILARQPLVVVEEPFVFGERFAGTSKATLVQGWRFIHQLAELRFGRLSRFAAVGAFGAVLNLAIMAGMIAVGSHYIAAAVVAAATTILTNFALQERLVFHDLRHEGKSFWLRLGLSVGFNGADAALRLPVLYLIVEFTPLPSVIAQALTLIVAFVIRFLYHSRIVYRPRLSAPRPADQWVDETVTLDESEQTRDL